MDQNAINALVNHARDAVSEVSPRVGAVSVDVLENEIPIALATANGTTRVVVLDEVVKYADARRLTPRRRTGTQNLEDLASLIALVNRQKNEGTTVCFASKSGAPVVVVIFDWHRGTDSKEADSTGVSREPGWGEDRAIYQPKLSRAWQAWNVLASAGNVSQDQFADFLEDHLDEIGEKAGFPRKLDLLQMARDLHVAIGTKFQRSVDPSTGEVSLVSMTTNGESRTKVPREFVLAIPVFEGSDVVYSIRCGLRMKLDGDKAFFAVTIRNADVALDDAFGDVKAAIAEQCSIPVFAGRAG